MKIQQAQKYYLVRTFLSLTPSSHLWLCPTATLEDPNVIAECVGVGEEELTKKEVSINTLPLPAESQPEMNLSYGGKKWNIKWNPSIVFH